jgi:hypothetical protein
MIFGDGVGASLVQEASKQNDGSKMPQCPQIGQLIAEMAPQAKSLSFCDILYRRLDHRHMFFHWIAMRIGTVALTLLFISLRSCCFLCSLFVSCIVYLYPEIHYFIFLFISVLTCHHREQFRVASLVVSHL